MFLTLLFVTLVLSALVSPFAARAIHASHG